LLPNCDAIGNIGANGRTGAVRNQFTAEECLSRNQFCTEVAVGTRKEIYLCVVLDKQTPNAIKNVEFEIIKIRLSFVLYIHNPRKLTGLRETFD